MSKKPTFLALDGNALLHRAWHALPPLITKDGLVVNAAYGFAMVMEKMLEKYKPDNIAVAWDLPGKTFRHEFYKEYKGHRKKKEQELYDQIPIIRELLEAYGVVSIDAKGFEADDVIATLAKDAEKNNFHTLIVTGDLDSLQLVNKSTDIIFFQKGISVTKTYDTQAVFDRYELTPDQLIDYKALRGDPSDNIPGIKGVGEKTATNLIKDYGSIEGVYKALEKEEIVEKTAKKLRGNKQAAMDSKYLVKLILDIKLDPDFSKTKLKGRDSEKLLEMFSKLEFRTLLRKYGGVVVEKKIQNIKTNKNIVEIVRDEKKLTEFIKTLSKDVVGVLIAEQQADLFGGTLAAIGISDGCKTMVIPNPTKNHLNLIKEDLNHVKKVITHDLKNLLHEIGFGINISFDTKIAAYLLNSGSRSYDLSSVAQKVLNKKIEEVPESFNKDADYKKFAQSVFILPDLSNKLINNLNDAEMLKIFIEMEMPLVTILYNMEKVGIELNAKSLEKFSKELKVEIEKLDKKIRHLAKIDFNVNSPLQLSEILFEKMGLPTKKIKKTKTGYSTAASELEKLWDEHEIIPLISKYRELTKLQSTYVDALPRLVESDGRIHTTYNQTVTATGRLSSSEPNLQNIPIKTELGRKIRNTFIASKGKKLIAADYSQIELRLVSVVAQDKPFIDAFNEGADIHKRTASEVLGIHEIDITKEQRYSAKAINFGIIYGMGARSLSRSTDMTFAEAKMFIEKYFEIHSSIKDYLDETKNKAHEEGFVTTMFGRRRYFPEINSGMPQLIAQAERMAINMPIQGAASDIMKMAMVVVDKWVEKSGLDIKVLMQVHDELVFECGEKDVEKAVLGIKKSMEDVVSFDVPLVVDVEYGDNWGEMKTWNK